MWVSVWAAAQQPKSEAHKDDSIAYEELRAKCGQKQCGGKIAMAVNG